jgi:hypothetical protein
VGRVGVFDPELRQEALFDPEILQEGWVDRDAIQLLSVAPPLPPASTAPDSEFPLATLYDFLEMQALATANVAGLPVKIYTDFIAPAGVTDLSPLLAIMNRPRVLLLFSQNDSPFAVDLDAGFNAHMHTVFYAVFRQSAPLILQISCPAESSIRMIAVGDP